MTDLTILLTLTLDSWLRVSFRQDVFEILTNIKIVGIHRKLFGLSVPRQLWWMMVKGGVLLSLKVPKWNACWKGNFYKTVLRTLVIFLVFLHLDLFLGCLLVPSAERLEQCARYGRWWAGHWGYHWQSSVPPWAAWSGASPLSPSPWMRRHLCSSLGPGDAGLDAVPWSSSGIKWVS